MIKKIVIYLTISFAIAAVCADERPNKTVLIFGVFDLLHPGHLSFIKQAQQFGDRIIAVVTRDSIVQQLKKRSSCHNEHSRLEQVKSVDGIHAAVLGDKILGAYTVLFTYKPDIICLGYDQQTFGKHLQDAMRSGTIPNIEIVYLFPFEANRYHTSLLRNQLNSSYCSC